MTGSKKKQTNSIEIVRPPLSRTFDIPAPDDLLKVFEGDNVKLIFKGGRDVERMWVTVLQAGKMDHWIGTLDNDPITEGVASKIKYGDEVHFHPYDVIDVDLHKRIDQRKERGDEDEKRDKAGLENKIDKPWFKNPQITVPLLVGMLGATATIIAATL